MLPKLVDALAPSYLQGHEMSQKAKAGGCIIEAGSALTKLLNRARHGVITTRTWLSAASWKQVLVCPDSINLPPFLLATHKPSLFLISGK